MDNHYDWLEKNLPIFFSKLNLNYEKYAGIIVSDGDKCYSAKGLFKENDIPFNHGVALYLLTKTYPHCNEVRNTPDGWVDPFEWIVKSYEKFKKYLPKA